MARLHSRILHGLCREGVLITATMTARFPRKAKKQKGTLTAHRTASCTKEVVSLRGMGNRWGRPHLALSYEMLAPLKIDLITAITRKNKHTARMLANARKDYLIPLAHIHYKACF